MAAKATELPPFVFRDLADEITCNGLKCTNAEINDWFWNQAKKEHERGSVRVTCVVEREKPHRPLGFYALATVAEEVCNLPGAYHPFRGGEHFSALQLVWLATDSYYANLGLGKIMGGHAILRFAQIGQQIGLPHLIVVPAEQDYDKLVAFYSRLGFTPYKDGEAMFLNLEFAVDALEKARARARAAQAAA